MSNSSPRRRQRGKSSSTSMVGSTVKTLAATAVVAFGAYKVYEYLAPPGEATGEEDGDETFTLPQWLSSLWLDEKDSSEPTESDFHRQPARKKPPPKKKPDPRTRHRLAQQSIRKCRQDIRNAYATCWPTLQQVLEDCTNTVPLTQELRSLRQKNKGEQNQERQDELWQRIQTETFTKFVATTYASSLLLLSLTLQLHWIAGQLFQQQQQQQQQKKHGTSMCESPPITARMAQEVMMQSHEYFKTQGLPLLINAVRRAIAATPMGEEWRPTTFVTLSELQHALERVDTHLERGRGSSYSRNWIRMVLPDPTRWEEEDSDKDNSDDEMESEGTVPHSSLLEAFWDLAESPAWQDAQLQTLQATRQYLQDKGWGKEFLHPVSHAVDADKETKDCTVAEEDPVHVPLAKLMAPLKSSCGLVGSSETTKGSNDASAHMEYNRPRRSKNSLLVQLQKLSAVLELGDVSFQE